MLVVDDDPKAVEVIAAFLPAPAYAVVRAYGGSEAIALAQRLRPDLILLDLMMPDVNGFDVVEALQRNADTARIPILVVTAKQITGAGPRRAQQQSGQGHPHRRKGRVRPAPLHRRSPARAAAALERAPDGQNTDH